MSVNVHKLTGIHLAAVWEWHAQLPPKKRTLCAGLEASKGFAWGLLVGERGI